MKSTALFLSALAGLSVYRVGAAETPAPAEIASPTIVICEIMYHPMQELYGFPAEEVQDSSFEYFELVNLTGEPVSLSGWRFRDSRPIVHEFAFPPGTVIAPYGYLVVCNNVGVMRDPRAYGAILTPQNSVGDFDFNLANDEDSVEIIDNLGFQIDYVFYGDGDPTGSAFRRRWPRFPDGSGPSLVLTDLYADNTIPENWWYSGLRGNPGTGILVPPTATPTPTATHTPTITPTFTPTFTATPTPWVDFNFDRRVDAEDLLRLLQAYSAGSATPEVNADGRLDRLDILIFSLHWQMP